MFVVLDDGRQDARLVVHHLGNQVGRRLAEVEQGRHVDALPRGGPAVLLHATVDVGADLFHGRPRVAQPAPQLGQAPRELLLGAGLEEGFLVLEVQVDAALAHPGAFGDVLDRGLLEAVAAEDLSGGVEDGGAWVGTH
nr:hypothetical protein MFMH1_21040 [Myxococcus sp. MH1]